MGRGEVGDAVRLERNGSHKISLDHIVKERYPTFVDALRDLDDALSLLFLFANLPSTATVPPQTIALCQRLCLEFEHYLITTHTVRKTFLSIKGIYYQATIQGQDILWLVPYKFVQRVTGDVDFRIMGTFVEFYTTLLGFVNFRLYTSIGLVYPPKFNTKSDEQGGELGAFTLEGREIGGAPKIESIEMTAKEETDTIPNGAVSVPEDVAEMVASIREPEITTGEAEPRATELIPAEEVNGNIDTFEITGEGADLLQQPQISGTEAAHLFSAFTFFLSRETPRQPLEFLLRAFGCKRVGWDAVLGDGAFTHDEKDPTITHQVVDRPPLQNANNGADSELVNAPPALVPGGRVPGRIYIQPQWVWDCVNGAKLLPPVLYAPGATLPPHLSPWVKPKKGAYDPIAPLAEQEQEGEAELLEGEEGEMGQDGEHDEEDEESIEDEVVDSKSMKHGTFGDFEKIQFPPANDNDMSVAESDSSGEERGSAKDVPSDNDSFSGFASPSPPPSQQAIHQAELEAEATGQPLKSILKGPNRSDAIRKRKREEEEELERRKGMMSRRKRKTFEKMQYGLAKGEVEAENLRRKRRGLEKGSRASN